MKYLFMFKIALLFSCRIPSNAQQVVEHYDINSCKYRVDTITNNSVAGISFFDCVGNSIIVNYQKVDTLPKNILNNNEWNFMLKNEISKITQKDINIILVYGIVLNKSGEVLNIEKLTKNVYEIPVEEKIIQIIKQSQWKPAIKDGKAVNYYFSLPIKINLM